MHGGSAMPPIADVSLRRSEPPLRANNRNRARRAKSATLRSPLGIRYLLTKPSGRYSLVSDNCRAKVPRFSPAISALGWGGNSSRAAAGRHLPQPWRLHLGFIYFVVFIAVVYFLIVLPYKAVMARQGKVVFGSPPPTRTCPACLSDDLNPAATRCKHCGSDIGRAAP